MKNTTNKQKSTATKNNKLNDIFFALQKYERLYQFRDPNNSCLFSLRINECYTLELIISEDQRTVLEIASDLGIHKSNATRITQSLESQKLIERFRDESDGRLVIWEATNKGKDLYNEIRKYLVSRFRQKLTHFSVQEIETFVEILEALTDDAKDRMKLN